MTNVNLSPRKQNGSHPPEWPKLWDQDVLEIVSSFQFHLYFPKSACSLLGPRVPCDEALSIDLVNTI